MNEPVQLAPSLAIYDDDGELTVRTSDLGQWRLVTPQVIKAIGEAIKPRKLTLITPTDTKVFKFGTKESSNGRLHSNSESGGAAGPNASSDGSPASDRGAEGSDIGGRPQDPIPRASARIQQDHSAPPAPEIVADVQDEYEQELRRQQQDERELAQAQSAPTEPSAPAKTRSRERPAPEVRTETQCGRCYGQGKLEGGGTCPVCRGRKVIAKWGRGRK